MKALYDITKTYQENADHGPFFEGTIPPRSWPKENEWTDFLGQRVASPIGVPAGPLLNANWIALAAKLGYDILTYKTIRSHKHPSHPLPNVVPIESPTQLMPGSLPDHLMISDKITDVTENRIGITNSFGNPSQSEEFLRQDIPRALEVLQPGQTLIVSVFGAPEGNPDVIQDFVTTARFAKECGVPLIEANTSCPNVKGSEGSLYNNPEMIFKLSQSLIKTLKDTPLILKVGAFSNPDVMRNTFLAAARAGARAICGINTIPMKVIDHYGKPALGPDRITCGICGNPIREAALDFVRKGRAIIEEEKLDLQLIATGGATKPEHFQQFLDAGAHIAMTATGMMWNPLLATQYHQESHEKRPCKTTL